MNNNYDKIANSYDFLSRMVFGRAQVNAQIHQLKYLPTRGNILIVGGGTGWILEEIAKIHPSGLNITYVEVSAKMILLSMKRNTHDNEVTFYRDSIENFESNCRFDAILTPFLFDNFSTQTAEMVFKKLNLLLINQGVWLMVDFTLKHGSIWWKQVFLKLMYQFFRILSNVETKTLVDTEVYFDHCKYKIIAVSFYFGRFIKAIVYLK
ncbi:class I SAM-dependent methyltransferase [Pedobacter sandarakinus]|uniref:class I SAM-dependent methyltransferase n=1 Tax=Pedobacter sandarakinus TaxID=353156 RepID=UPI0022459DCB|nr:class I SAM-dependent methyltransferase [Pedobacter sandarakinus]MCX2573233.1 class I SAM-dependent methyltransferase [Pedobacter sandarakinus]